MAAARVAVVGAGWAGIAAAVRAVEAGCRVALFEIAAQPGGRARTADADAALDNGQHILIGAYSRTLALMRTVGADPDALLLRRPLVLRHADGRGLALPPGPPLLALARGIAGFRGWTWRDRAAFALTSARWAAAGFRCDPSLTVAALCLGLPPAVRGLLIDPLCVAALNTPAAQASAAVFLRVLKDALLGGRGSADLLLPRRPLGELLPLPALGWLRSRGAEVRLGTRVRGLARDGTGWTVDGERFGAVVLAASAGESARLAEPFAPAWTAAARALRHEPIVTVYLKGAAGRWPAPMVALADGDDAPAQFAFDHGALGGRPGRFALVASGASRWVERGLETTARAALAQAAPLVHGARVERVIAERRATFLCTPALARPAGAVAPGLWAAGDFVDGAYPATLEGAVRAGEAAAAALQRAASGVDGGANGAASGSPTNSDCDGQATLFQ